MARKKRIIEDMSYFQPLNCIWLFGIDGMMTLNFSYLYNYSNIKYTLTSVNMIPNLNTDNNEMKDKPNSDDNH